ncbi:hypothetical protein [Variovorax sp. Sphag1AA]|uniref:hypothetical protein n=1 Tax=Variovorax sp. Sphag1AA TaxID=2587027 RepID=UPI001616C65E|nr:hypothetical protein [Variovorax sp. Sphag1AA]MBB3181153.1 hypothetical protein [Variovorax sp. Sphag1AA]
MLELEPVRLTLAEAAQRERAFMPIYDRIEAARLKAGPNSSAYTFVPADRLPTFTGERPLLWLSLPSSEVENMPRLIGNLNADNVTSIDLQSMSVRYSFVTQGRSIELNSSHMESAFDDDCGFSVLATCDGSVWIQHLVPIDKEQWEYHMDHLRGCIEYYFPDEFNSESELLAAKEEASRLGLEFYPPNPGTLRPEYLSLPLE